MSHDHHHHAHHHHGEVKNLKLAFFLNLGFTIIEFIGGLWTNSTAIIADAIHDLGDSFALAQAWYFESISDKSANKKYTYGYRRFTLLGAVISALVLLLSSFFVINEAIQRILEPEQSNAQGMILLALLGIAVNGFAMLKLVKGKSQNVRLVALHLLEDVLGWVAILVAAIILLFKDIPALDPILAILITLYILYNIVKRLKSIVPVFLQATPEDIDAAAIEQQIINIKSVDSVHQLQLWSLDGEQNVLTAHVVSTTFLSAQEYAELKNALKEVVKPFGIYHSTFEIEFPEETCRNHSFPRKLRSWIN